MKKNIRNYNINNNNTSVGQNSGSRNSNNERKIEQEVEKDLNRYGNMSQSQLMQELLKVAEEEKRKGNLTPEMLDTFYQTVTPAMDDEQRRKMNGIINELKN